MEDLEPGWKPPTWRRSKELARRVRLTLADIIELTGHAPDTDGQIGIFDVDDSGFQYTLSEASLRGRPAEYQSNGRRLVEEGRLLLPCTPPELLAFNDQWQELDVPERFVAEVRGLESEREADEWRDDLVLRLESYGLADLPIDYAAFRTLTVFGGESSPAEGEDALYAYRRDELGHVVAIEAAGSVLEVTGFGEGQIAAEHQRDGHLALPTTARELVRWVRLQGGRDWLDYPGNPDWPAVPGNWVEFIGKLNPGKASDSAAVPGIRREEDVARFAHLDLHPAFQRAIEKPWKSVAALARRAIADLLKNPGSEIRSEGGKLYKRNGSGGSDLFTEEAMRKALGRWLKEDPDRSRTKAGQRTNRRTP